MTDAQAKNEEAPKDPEATEVKDEASAKPQSSGIKITSYEPLGVISAADLPEVLAALGRKGNG